MRVAVRSVLSALTLVSAIAIPVGPSALAQSNWQQQQQWQRQQDMQRQQQMQQEQQRRQMQEQQRRQMQEQQRQQMQAQQRQQMQEQQRRQMQEQQRQQMQTQQRQQMQTQQRQQMQTKQQAQQRQQQQTAQRQRQQMQKQGTLGKDGKPTGVVVSGGVAKMARPLTPAEIQRGFTGRVTADGRALIKYQGRIFVVPASRVSGLSARLSKQRATPRATQWTAQQKTVVEKKVAALANSGVSSKALVRIDAARQAGPDVRRIDYSNGFEKDVQSFNQGFRKFSGKLEKEMILVQYFDGDKEVGKGRTLQWWTTVEQANSMDTIRAVKGNLGLPWGARNSVAVARIPAGTEVEYLRGTARSQDSENFLTYYKGGGEQFRFKNFDPSWVVETQRIPE